MQCDFIWYRQAKVRSILQGHEYSYVNSFPAFPNLSHPSDHIPLISTFSVPRREWVLTQATPDYCAINLKKNLPHFFTNKYKNYSQLVFSFFSSAAFSFSFISCFPSSHLDQEFNQKVILLTSYLAYISTTTISLFLSLIHMILSSHFPASAYFLKPSQRHQQIRKDISRYLYFLWQVRMKK